MLYIFFLLSFSGQIRKKEEADLRTPPRRADARKHKICDYVSSHFGHMLWFIPDP
ncbi:hypothetical protein BN129_3322 [Cronobacter sakazakii 701]|nr:hypothetical protein BN129_3322 [Cronobacter sakazakii 701]